MKIDLDLPDWGDTLYYIDFDEKKKKVLLSIGSFVGVCLSFSEMIFQVCDVKSQKQKDVDSRWCFSDVSKAERARESIQYNYDKHDLWSLDILRG